MQILAAIIEGVADENPDNMDDLGAAVAVGASPAPEPTAAVTSPHGKTGASLAPPSVVEPIVAAQAFVFKIPLEKSTPPRLLVFDRTADDNLTFVPGGKAEPMDRSPLTTCRRELFEETGFTAPAGSLRLTNLGKQVGDYKGKYVLYDFVLAVKAEDWHLFTNREPAKHTNMRWLSVCELLQANPETLLDRLALRATAAWQTIEGDLGQLMVGSGGIGQPLLQFNSGLRRRLQKFCAKLREKVAQGRVRTPEAWEGPIIEDWDEICENSARFIQARARGAIVRKAPRTMLAKLQRSLGEPLPSPPPSPPDSLDPAGCARTWKPVRLRFNLTQDPHQPLSLNMHVRGTLVKVTTRQGLHDERVLQSTSLQYIIHCRSSQSQHKAEAGSAYVKITGADNDGVGMITCFTRAADGRADRRKSCQQAAQPDTGKNRLRWFQASLNSAISQVAHDTSIAISLDEVWADERTPPALQARYTAVLQRIAADNPHIRLIDIRTVRSETLRGIQRAFDEVTEAARAAEASVANATGMLRTVGIALARQLKDTLLENLKAGCDAAGFSANGEGAEADAFATFTHQFSSRAAELQDAATEQTREARQALREENDLVDRAFQEHVRTLVREGAVSAEDVQAAVDTPAGQQHVRARKGRSARAVEIAGLHKDTIFNGATGVVASAINAKGRYNVVLDKPCQGLECIGVRPEHILNVGRAGDEANQQQL